MRADRDRLRRKIWSDDPGHEPNGYARCAGAGADQKGPTDFEPIHPGHIHVSDGDVDRMDAEKSAFRPVGGR